MKEEMHSDFIYCFLTREFFFIFQVLILLTKKFEVQISWKFCQSYVNRQFYVNESLLKEIVNFIN